MNTILAVFGLGGWEIVLILAVVLIFFGAKRLPELAKGLGSGLKEFKKATREVSDELQNAGDDKAQAQNKSASITPAQPAQTVSQSSTPPKA